jgi:hypothetical protein
LDVGLDDLILEKGTVLRVSEMVKEKEVWIQA